MVFLEDPLRPTHANCPGKRFALLDLASPPPGETRGVFLQSRFRLERISLTE